MTTAKIETLEAILSDARKNGCKNVKLQLYDTWNDVQKEQYQPSQAEEEYQIDLRFYNTVEFETEIVDQQATDKLLTKIEGDTLIIRVALSDLDALLRNLGVEDDYNH